MIRRSVPADRDWIRTVAAKVYSDLGDYGTIIPSWLDHPGVLAYVEEDDQPPYALRGFALLGFYEPDNGRDSYVADLLAIAVHQDHRRRGIGRRLLEYTIQVAKLVGEHNAVREIRLTVADGNRIGQRLYSSTGFHILDEDHGSYEGGQRAIRMARGL